MVEQLAGLAYVAMLVSWPWGPTVLRRSREHQAAGQGWT
jgi:hypothetical protein